LTTPLKGDEKQPSKKAAHYHYPTVMALTGLNETPTTRNSFISTYEHFYVENIIMSTSLSPEITTLRLYLTHFLMIFPLLSMSRVDVTSLILPLITATQLDPENI